MAAAAFNGGGNGLRIGNVEAKMMIDTSGGGWFEGKMVIEEDTSGQLACLRVVTAGISICRQR